MSRVVVLSTVLCTSAFFCTSALFGATISTGVSPSNLWTFEQIRDPVHKGGDIANAQYSDRATGGGEGRVALVRCWTATGLLDIRFQLGPDAAGLSGDVTWRFDRGQERQGHWRVTATSSGVVVPDALLQSFAGSMRAARSLELRLKNGTDTDLQFVVPLTGSAAPIGKVAGACTR